METIKQYIERQKNLLKVFKKPKEKPDLAKMSKKYYTNKK